MGMKEGFVDKDGQGRLFVRGRGVKSEWMRQIDSVSVTLKSFSFGGAPILPLPPPLLANHLYFSFTIMFFSFTNMFFSFTEYVFLFYQYVFPNMHSSTMCFSFTT